MLASKIAKSVLEKLPLLVIVLAVTVSLVTYLTVGGTVPLSPSYQNIITLLLVNLALIALLGWLVGRRIYAIAHHRRKAKLHRRMVRVFTFLTAAPALAVIVASVLFFNLIVNAWFSTLVNRALDSTSLVAQAYLSDHEKRLQAETSGVREYLDSRGQQIYLSTSTLTQELQRLATGLELAGAIVFEQSGRVITKVGDTPIEQQPNPPPTVLEAALDGNTRVFAPLDGSERIYSLVRLQRTPTTYLYLIRTLDGAALSHIEAARLSANEYDKLKAGRRQLQGILAGIFIAAALLLLLSAVLVGLKVADSIAEPIQVLTQAAERINFKKSTPRIKPFRRQDELNTLATAFNAMQRRIQSQKRDLEERTKFTETVLKGLSPGVLGLDAKGIIKTHNLSADTVCGVNFKTDTSIGEISKTLGGLWKKLAQSNTQTTLEEQVQLKNRTVFVRINATLSSSDEASYKDFSSNASVAGNAGGNGVGDTGGNRASNTPTTIEEKEAMGGYTGGGEDNNTGGREAGSIEGKSAGGIGGVGDTGGNRASNIRGVGDTGGIGGVGDTGGSADNNTGGGESMGGNGDGKPTRKNNTGQKLVPKKPPKISGYVVTIDDMTSLMVAERRAAWSDVARRIAHEIKNPLTPLQLCAEWLIQDKSLKNNKQAQTRLRTIVNQVRAVSRMTNEFASFARLPTPRIERASPRSVAEDAVFLQRQAFSKVNFTTEFINLRKPDGSEYRFSIDPILISQLLINLLKNAAEACEAISETGSKVTLRVEHKPHKLCFVVEDNGIGIQMPSEKLIEPYVTTRAQGTGLGLAVVNKITADHGGSFTISKGKQGGTVAEVVIPSTVV